MFPIVGTGKRRQELSSQFTQLDGTKILRSRPRLLLQQERTVLGRKLRQIMRGQNVWVSKPLTEQVLERE
jgi:hypothetical protein